MKQGKFPIEIWNVPGELGHTNKQTILRLDSKDNAFNFGRFMTISGHFFANYINIFHKKKSLDSHFELIEPQFCERY